MKIPFLKQLLRLAGPAANEVVVTANGPEIVGMTHVMQYLLAEMPDLLMAAVMDVATGKPLATYTAVRELRPGIVGGFHAEAVRQVQASMAAQGAGEVLGEMLCSLPNQLCLLHLVSSGRLFIYLAVDQHDTNLAIAREVMRGGIRLLEPASA